MLAKYCNYSMFGKVTLRLFSNLMRLRFYYFRLVSLTESIISALS